MSSKAPPPKAEELLKIFSENQKILKNLLTKRDLYGMIIKRSRERNRKCGHGGTGRRARLRGVWATIRVQVPVTAPTKRPLLSTGQKRSFWMMFAFGKWCWLRQWWRLRLMMCGFATFYGKHHIIAKRSGATSYLRSKCFMSPLAMHHWKVLNFMI